MRHALASSCLALLVAGCPGGSGTGPDPSDGGGAPENDGGAAGNDGGAPGNDGGQDGPVLSPGTSTFTVAQEVDGQMVEREVILAAPSELSGADYPVLLALHGADGQNDHWVGELASLVEAGAFVGVYPQGHNGFWALGPEPSNADDVAFLNAVMNHLDEIQGLDTDRAYVLGYSNGAGMAHRVAIYSDRFRAFAALATSLTNAAVPGPMTAAVSVLQVQGIDDEIIPYDGGASPVGHTFLAAEESAALWAANAECDAEATTTVEANGDRRLEWGGCTGDHEVVHIGLSDVGHELPSDYSGGLMNYAWEFLSQH